ncbi:hypothetical protein C3B51_11720 [Pseudoalteromonas rubra]|uniref:Uncharacterized protein n=1 Tax=Pseudoalteromonas rubra TaxID=43658 RepID=A0A4Q7ED06_9GAMM|nr:hypothetical protein C3B51_11720 [Pseudoalteromonas rubra]
MSKWIKNKHLFLIFSLWLIDGIKEGFKISTLQKTTNNVVTKLSFILMHNCNYGEQFAQPLKNGKAHSYIGELRSPKQER